MSYGGRPIFRTSMEGRRWCHWAVVGACLLLGSCALRIQGHAGCTHDHSHDDFGSQGHSSLQGDDYGGSAHQGHEHHGSHHSHGHHHHHGHDHQKQPESRPRSNQGNDKSWRPAEEMAEERELNEFGFEDAVDYDDESNEAAHDNLDVGLWLRAMGSSLVVSLASLVCLALLPFLACGGGMLSRTFVDSLAAFGVGAMLGDAFLHQLPHAFGGAPHSHSHGNDSHGHDHAHDHSHVSETAGKHGHSFADLSVGLSVLVGILLFFIVEKIVRRVEESSGQGAEAPFNGGHKHHHHHHHHQRSHHQPARKDGKKGAKEEEEGKEREGREEEKTVAGSSAEDEKKREGGEAREEEREEREEEREEVEDGFVLANGKAKRGKADAKGIRQRKNASGETSGAAKIEGAGAPAATEASPPPAESASAGNAEADKKREKKKKKKAKEEDPEPELVEPAKRVEEKKGGQKLKEGMALAPGGSNMVLGYLNLFSDGVHNFTDGMSLGAAFLHRGTVGGYGRMLFMLAHELPQEVGDFGILLRAGFSITKALAFNFLSALMAMAGTALALILGGDPGYSNIIEGFTAGGFIYIAVAGVMPDMHTRGSGVGLTLLQLAAMLMGIAVAVGIALLE